MKSGSYVYNSTKGKKERIGRILQMHANTRAGIEEVYSGAIAAAVGDYDSLAEAAAHMCVISPAVLPDPEKKVIYDRKYALYCKTIECLDGLWDEMQQLIEGK